MDEQQDHKLKLGLVLAYQHSLRTALTTLDGYLSLVEMGDATIGAETAKKLRSDVKTVQDGVETMLKMLRLFQETNLTLTLAIRALERRRGKKGG